MRPLGLSAHAQARDLHVPPTRIAAILSEETPRAVTPDTALRLSRYFGTTPEFWLNLQAAYDLSKARAENASALPWRYDRVLYDAKAADRVLINASSYHGRHNQHSGQERRCHAGHLSASRADAPQPL
jgi:addiction module HigA family antidote